VVGVSRYILDHHLRLGLFANAQFSGVIPHESPSAAGTERRGDPEAPLTFGYLGRLVPEKGLERLIDAFKAHKSDGSRLLIAGVGEEGYSRELSRRAASGGQNDIHFSGWIEAPEFFRRVDVLVLPSLWQEPLGRVTLEACAHGVPVVGSRRGGIPEVVKDGITGLLFDPDDPGALVGACERLARDRGLLRGLSANALQRAREHSLDHIAGAYDDAYRQVLAPAPRCARGQ
jgi:glycosyltransferase involved in cell wall biosynthesis